MPLVRHPARAPLPLLERFPALATLPRAQLARLPTRVEQAEALAPSLWIKRDDLTADPFGGNKIRQLEFLLGGVVQDERVVTAGAWGSTHALATAIAVRKLGGHAVLLLWPQEMNPTAERIRRESAAAADEVHDVRGVVSAYARGLLERSRGARWIPPGGGTPLGALGFVNAALELAAQVRAGVLPAPARIVVPLGTGGTTAGLLVGLELAGLPSRVIAARVVPRIVANRGHVLWLAWRTAHLLRKLSGADVPSPRASRLEVVQDVYGGAYGRETERGREAAERYRAWSGRPLDPTYSAKALAAALALPEGGPTLFWLTYDARMARPASPRATP